MVATPITASTRYFRRGTSAAYFLASSSSTPTRAELNAGTDLSDEVKGVDGFNVESGEIETPDMGSVFVDKIGGSLNIDDSSITFYASVNGVDARSILPRGTTGHIVLMEGGDVAGRKGDRYPVTVRSVGKPVDLGDEAATVVISFSVTGEPVEDFTIPAA
jgi:hypothetical protein